MCVCVKKICAYYIYIHMYCHLANVMIVPLLLLRLVLILLTLFLAFLLNLISLRFPAQG